MDIVSSNPLQSKLSSYFCVVCGEQDPKKFYHHSNGRRNGLACKSCRKIYYADLIKKQNLMRRFGLTVSEYDAMLDVQGGVCAICKQPETAMGTNGRKVRALAVDHDHETGAIRQLLCSSCNYLLGYVEENAELLQSASEYLRRHKT